MLHAKQITLTANKTEATSTKTQFKVNKGVIFRVWITFPNGCNGLVKLRMFIEGHPFLPVEQDAFIRGNDIVFEIPIFFEITQEPQTITVEAWNEDEVHAHTIEVYMLILDRSLVLPVGATEGIMESLSSLIISNRKCFYSASRCMNLRCFPCTN